MKNVLFASTALVALSGAAWAEVTITGNAEMGLISGDGGVADTNDDVEFFTDIDVTFTMSGETDGGLTFGASIDLDESDGNDDGSASPAFGGRTQGGETIFLSGAFGTLTMGDTDGAMDWALTEVAFNSGSLNDDETEHAGYSGGNPLDGVYDGQILRYDYSFGDFGVGISAELNDDGDDDGGDDETLQIGFTYNLDLGGTQVGLGLGYADADDDDALGVSANASFGAGFTAGIIYIDGELDGSDFDHIGVGVGYTSGAISLSANYGEFDFDGDADDTDGFGLSAGYDLGGGASIQLGYGDSNFDGDSGDDDFETVSFGVRMNF